jgi:hypothetical protein
MVIFGFSYHTKLCSDPGCDDELVDSINGTPCALDELFKFNMRLKSPHSSHLKIPQGSFDTARYSLRCLKHGLPCPPYIVIGTLRNGVRKFVGLENGEREGGVIAWA